MKIIKIDLSEDQTSVVGLKPIKMERLGDVVLIAGKNGSGKTRLLEIIKSSIRNYPKENEVASLKRNIVNIQNSIDSAKMTIENNTKNLKDGNFDELRIQASKLTISKSESEIISYNDQIFLSNERLSFLKKIDIIPVVDESRVVDFVPKSVVLKDSYVITPQDLKSYSNRIYTIGTSSISEGTIPAIEVIVREWINVSTEDVSDISLTQEEIDEIIGSYEKLRKYIKLFLNTDLKRGRDGSPELFGKRIGEAKLSNGQKILLQFCMALYAQEISLKDLVIFMDEPENHLHPAALLDVLDKITPHVTNGQMWITTHSINVLSHFDPSCIWYIDEGEISYAGNVPKKVLEGLLGNDEEIEKLSHFLSLPAQMASTKFAYESLFYPTVAFTGLKDPQVAQINSIIQGLSENNQKLKVLDFGMGKGRLLATIAENERLIGNEIITWLDFIGYDKFEENREQCLQIFESIYGSDIQRYFNKESDLLTQHDSSTIDLVVMCNVFHEIEPSEWLSLFNSQNTIFDLLKDDGHLLIVEDQFLAIGEKAHSKGFLVFDQLEFKKLFKITSSDDYHFKDFNGDGRLKAHYIPKKCIRRINFESKREAIITLQQSAKKEIKELRARGSVSFRDGRLHGFWAQQLANSSLALDEIV